MITGKIKHILPRIGSLPDVDQVPVPEVKVYVILPSNERRKEILLGIVFTLCDGIVHAPVEYGILRDRHVKKQRVRARKIGGRFKKMIKDGFGKIVFLPQISVFKSFSQKILPNLYPDLNPKAINLKHWKDAPVIVTCDGDGYPMWGAGKLYRWDDFLVEIFIQHEHRYIYSKDDAAIENLYPELEGVIGEIRDGLVLSF